MEEERMKAVAITALSMLAVMTLITGVIYPLAVTGIGVAAFKDKASGSLIERKGRIIGSRLIGQKFEDARYFHGRPSTTTPAPYNAAASSGSNMGPLNPDLVKTIAERAETLRSANPEAKAAIPIDLVTASASGLDPEISPASAFWQAPRVAAARGLKVEEVERIVREHIRGRQIGILGEAGVNVLEINLALDAE